MTQIVELRRSKHTIAEIHSITGRSPHTIYKALRGAA